MKADYTDNSTTWAVPKGEDYFLSGVCLGWMGDLRLNQKLPFFLELGATLSYFTGKYNGEDYSKPNVRYDWHSRINAFTLTIPISVSYQFRNVYKEGLTIAPYVGFYGRFNIVADRRETKTASYYNINVKGEEVPGGKDVTVENKSLMKCTEDGGWMKGRSHVGKLFQPGVVIGVNAFYKRYSFGFSYMLDLVPFAEHNSPVGLYYKSTAQDGNLPSSGTGCDMKISTKHNISVTVGYIF